jgi:hypothetical protein
MLTKSLAWVTAILSIPSSHLLAQPRPLEGDLGNDSLISREFEIQSCPGATPNNRPSRRWADRFLTASDSSPGTVRS